jgi:hypothetical protein
MTGRERPEQRSTFVLKIEGRPGAEGIHALRFLLKRLLRQYGFRVIDAREVQVPDPISDGQHCPSSSRTERP